MSLTLILFSKPFRPGVRRLAPLRRSPLLKDLHPGSSPLPQSRLRLSVSCRRSVVDGEQTAILSCCAAVTLILVFSMATMGTALMALRLFENRPRVAPARKRQARRKLAPRGDAICITVTRRALSPLPLAPTCRRQPAGGGGGGRQRQLRAHAAAAPWAAEAAAAEAARAEPAESAC